MKATLFLTTSCNLRCDYCYVTRQDISMPVSRLAGAIDFAYQRVERTDRLDIGLFGGEPLLNWPLVQKAVSLIEQRSDDYDHAVRLSLVTNGTLLNEDILAYLHDHRIILQVSCDGLPHVQDLHRCFPGGRPSSAVVETNLVKALQNLPAVIVNMVYGPDTYPYLADAIDYLAALGVKQMVLNPDYTASWNSEKMAGLEAAFGRIVELYLEYYAAGTPLFISLIDEKIAVILRGGYAKAERCHMGYQEFAFSPQGYIFPCERLVGSGDWNRHSIGHLDQPYLLERQHCSATGNPCKNLDCRQCGVVDYCMNWCGCSNFFATGDYSRPSAFICASERYSIEAAFKVLQMVEDEDQLVFINHYAGLPMANSSADS